VNQSRVLKPTSLNEAISILKKFGDESRVIAGGQSLVPLISLGLADPNFLVSLENCRDLIEVTADENFIEIGAMVTVSQILKSDLIRDSLPVLHCAAKNVATPHVRNFGTLVGNVCHADPSSDVIPSLLCCDARVHLVSTEQSRVINLDDYIEAPFMISIKEGELVTAVSVPRTESNELFSYKKVARRAGDLGIATCAVILKVDKKLLTDVKISLGGYVQRATRLRNIEKKLINLSVDDFHLRINETKIIDEVNQILLPAGGLSGDYLSETFDRLVRSTLESALNGN
tara:strand:- start:2343 stop:3203 length:861 start_codon:yes stop_codon:yes gene_type:complete